MWVYRGHTRTRPTLVWAAVRLGPHPGAEIASGAAFQAWLAQQRDATSDVPAIEWSFDGEWLVVGEETPSGPPAALVRLLEGVDVVLADAARYGARLGG
ncbi:hypothetical protein [Litorihabitans aurantiacus]|uniref:Uncharacterized protein n=1 Tax=Litorihabitans aurantiacus TaxID=1930061 RepID=A0AA37XHJ6_9MICO|nr:hypothetical protein [Litorihabitans aurantiacus]GMA33231.1 hypothetical protein GCM10025875_32230 [Litorihabitans aurantiacus]